MTSPSQSTGGRTVVPVESFDAVLRLPGSKSLANRALLLAALAPGQTTVVGVPGGDDSSHMAACLEMLGFGLQRSAPASIQVTSPPKGITATHGHLQVGNAGTVARFLTAACCLGPRGSTYLVDGIARMRKRPIGELVDALGRLGGQVEYVDHEGYLPLRVRGGGMRGGRLEMPPTASSQFISALLLSAPMYQEGLDLVFQGPVTSQPYVAMTLNIMTAFGCTPRVDESFTRIQVAPGRYAAATYAVEPDASNASYFLAAAAMVPGSRCTIEGLDRGSLQGDIGFADLLHEMGAGLVFGRDFICVTAAPNDQPLRALDVDLNAMPDMVQTLATVALFAKGTTRIRNVGNLRLKETDRIAALQAELTRVGAHVTVEGDDLTINPPASGIPSPAAIQTYDDHRMAMSFALVGLRCPGIVILNPECVNKTFPDYFQYLARLGNKH